MVKEILLAFCVLLVLISALDASEGEETLKVDPEEPLKSISPDPLSNEDELSTAEYRHRGWGGGYGGWGRGYGGWGRGYGGWGRGYGGWGRGYGGWGRGYGGSGGGYGGGYGYGRGWRYY